MRPVCDNAGIAERNIREARRAQREIDGVDGHFRRTGRSANRQTVERGVCPETRCLEGESHAKLDSPRRLRYNRLSYRWGQNRVHCGDIGMVQEVRAAGVHGDRTQMILVLWI